MYHYFICTKLLSVIVNQGSSVQKQTTKKIQKKLQHTNSNVSQTFPTQKQMLRVDIKQANN